MSMTIEQAKSELMQIYGMLSPDKQRAIDTLVKIEPCEDAISRQQVKSDYADWYGYGYQDNWFYKHLKDIPSVNPQEPSGDLISLETVIEWLKTKDIIKLSSQEETARKELKALPSVKQEPKTGHWILTSDDDYEYCTCSECGYQNGENWIIGSQIKYCPNCGCHMVEQERSDKE